MTQKKDCENLKVSEKNWKRKIEIIEVAAKQAIRILKEAGVPFQDLLEQHYGEEMDMEGAYQEAIEEGGEEGMDEME